MSPSPVGRIVVVVAGYVLFGWLVLRGTSWLGGVLALPPLFDSLVVGLLGVGLLVAVAVAWRYPQMGLDAPDSPESGPR